MADVLIQVSSDSTDEGIVAPEELLFTANNWSQKQMGVVTGIDDDEMDGNVEYLVITVPLISDDNYYHDYNPQDVSITNLDNDSPGISKTPASASEKTEAGAEITFDIGLHSRPTANVNVPIIVSDTSESLTATDVLVFEPDDHPAGQTVTITGWPITYAMVTLPIR